LLAIAPGGVYEAQLGDNAYELLWRQRTGFAKVAIEAQAVCMFIYIFIIHLFKCFLLLACHSNIYKKHSRGSSFFQHSSVILALGLPQDSATTGANLRRIPSQTENIHRRTHSF